MITDRHCAEFLHCLDEDRFYDAHEVLEELWYPNRFNKSNEVKLLKGFINASVSFELIKRERLNPSEVAWSTYLKYKKLLFEISTSKQPLYHKIYLHIEATKKRLSGS